MRGGVARSIRGGALLVTWGVAAVVISQIGWGDQNGLALWVAASPALAALVDRVVGNPELTPDEIRELLADELRKLPPDGGLTPRQFFQTISGMEERADARQAELVALLALLRADIAARPALPSPNAQASLERLQAMPLPVTDATAPRPPELFTGRREQLDAVAERLLEGEATAITALQGMGGIGKTALARQLAEERKADFPGGVFYADLPATDGNAIPILRAWGRACGQDLAGEADATVLASVVRHALGERGRERGRLLLILDDVRRDAGWLAGARLLQSAAPAGVPLLLTTRHADLAAALGTAVYRLDALEPEEARALLAKHAGEAAGLLDREGTAVDGLLETIGYLPLAIELAGRRLALNAAKPGYTVAKLATAVAERALSALELDGQRGLAATFAITYEALPEGARRLFRGLGIFAPGPIRRLAAAGVLDVAPDGAEEALDTLVHAALLGYGEQAETYVLHPLLREYAGTLIAAEEETERLQERHIAFYFAYAEANAREERAAHDRLEAALPNLLLAVHYAQAQEQHVAVRDFGYFLYGNSRFLDMRGYNRDAIGLLGAAVDACRVIGDGRGEGTSLANLGTALLNLGQLKQALEYLQQALAVVQEIGDKAGEGAALNSIAQIYDARGDYAKALDFLQQALAIFREIGDKAGEGAALNNIAQNSQARGDYATALEYLQQALAISQEIGNRAGEGIALNNIAQNYHARGDYATALEYLQQALAIRQEIGDKAGEGTTLNNISQIFKARGKYVTALEYLQQALSIRQEIGDRAGEGSTLNNIAGIYLARGDYAKALDFLQQVLAIRQEIGDKAGEGVALNNVSQIYHARGEYATALEYLQQALAILQEIGDKAGEGVALNNISQIYHARGEYAMALDFLQQSLAISQEIGNKAGEGATLNNISQIFKARGDYATALEYLQQALAIRLEIGDKAGEGTTLNNISQIFKARGDYATALDFLQQSLAISQEIGDVAGMCATLFNLGGMHWQNGEQEEALGVWAATYRLAARINLANVLAALEDLAQQLGLPGGLAGWQALVDGLPGE